jgi:hypothetical protein
MTEQEELIQDIKGRLGEMPKGALPFNLLAFATTILDDAERNHPTCYARSRCRGRQLPHRVEIALKAYAEGQVPINSFVY